MLLAGRNDDPTSLEAFMTETPQFEKAKHADKIEFPWHPENPSLDPPTNDVYT